MQDIFYRIIHFAQTSLPVTAEQQLARDGTTQVATAVFILWLFILAILLFAVICMWKIYEKAGKPGWGAIIPVYNSWLLFEITGYPGWLALLLLVPIVNLFPAIISIFATFKLGKAFGKSDVFSVLLVLFPLFTLPVLAFGRDKFNGNGSEPASGQPGSQEPLAPVA